MPLCLAFQEDLIAYDFLRNGPLCANPSCLEAIGNHNHRPQQQGMHLTTVKTLLGLMTYFYWILFFVHYFFFNISDFQFISSSCVAML
jgi:hypothetical protein